MPIEISPQEHDEIVGSLKRYFAEELDDGIGDLRARLLLEYILTEIAPLAYNRGVSDAEQFLRRQIEDLPATCFEPALTFWPARKRK